MFRKILLSAVPVAALALMLCGTDNSASQAFAKGSRGGHGMRNFSHRGEHNRYFGRYWGWGYPYYVGYGYPSYDCNLCQPQPPVVTASVTPVCPTCEPVSDCCYPSYWGWGYGRYRDHFRFHGSHSHGRGGRR
jgi:hypothetical protein